VLTVTSWEADETAEPLATHYTMAFAVTGYAKGRTALLADQATSTLHAATVAALMAWTPSESGLGEPAEEGAERRLLDTEESAVPVGEFVARFTMLCIAPLGSPYTS
jgi:hypothetical protein